MAQLFAMLQPDPAVPFAFTVEPAVLRVEPFIIILIAPAGFGLPRDAGFQDIAQFPPDLSSFYTSPS